MGSDELKMKKKKPAIRLKFIIRLLFSRANCALANKVLLALPYPAQFTQSVSKRVCWMAPSLFCSVLFTSMQKFAVHFK